MIAIDRRRSQKIEHGSCSYWMTGISVIDLSSKTMSSGRTGAPGEILLNKGRTHNKPNPHETMSNGIEPESQRCWRRALIHCATPACSPCIAISVSCLVISIWDQKKFLSRLYAVSNCSMTESAWFSRAMQAITTTFICTKKRKKERSKNLKRYTLDLILYAREQNSHIL